MKGNLMGEMRKRTTCQIRQVRHEHERNSLDVFIQTDTETTATSLVGHWPAVTVRQENRHRLERMQSFLAFTK